MKPENNLAFFEWYQRDAVVWMYHLFSLNFWPHQTSQRPRLSLERINLVTGLLFIFGFHHMLSMLDRSSFQIFWFLFPWKVWLLIICRDTLSKSWNSHFPNLNNKPTLLWCHMMSSFLNNSFSAWKIWINAAIGTNSKFRY